MDSSSQEEKRMDYPGSLVEEFMPHPTLVPAGLKFGLKSSYPLPGSVIFSTFIYPWQTNGTVRQSYM